MNGLVAASVDACDFSVLENILHASVGSVFAGNNNPKDIQRSGVIGIIRIRFWSTCAATNSSAMVTPPPSATKAQAKEEDATSH